MTNSDSIVSFYRSAFERNEQGFCLLEKVVNPADSSPDFRYLLTNPAFEQLVGLRQLINKPIREGMPDLDAHRMGHYNQVALTGHPAHFQQYVSPLGHWLDVHAFRVESHDPPRIGVLVSPPSEHQSAQETSVTDFITATE